MSRADSGVRVEEILATDETTFRAWYAVLDACERELWPDEQGWSFVEKWAQATERSAAAARLHWVARDASGAVVGSARLELPLADNTFRAEIRVWVLPGARRRGVGSALLATGERAAGTAGRTTVRAYVDRGAGEAVPGEAFAARHGYALVQRDERCDVAVPASGAALSRLEADAAPHAVGYELVGWVGATPADLLGARAVLAERISADAPSGDAHVEPERWDADRVRERDALVTGMDRTGITTAARHESTGGLVGITDITVPNAAPELAWQWDTVVLPGHRGHRLGILLKSANLRRLAATVPATRRVATWNAEDNAPMIAVNEALGYRLTGESLTWERTL